MVDPLMSCLTMVDIARLLTVSHANKSLDGQIFLRRRLSASRIALWWRCNRARLLHGKRVSVRLRSGLTHSFATVVWVDTIRPDGVKTKTRGIALTHCCVINKIGYTATTYTSGMPLPATCRINWSDSPSTWQGDYLSCIFCNWVRWQDLISVEEI